MKYTVGTHTQLIGGSLARIKTACGDEEDASWRGGAISITPRRPRMNALTLDPRGGAS